MITEACGGGAGRHVLDLSEGLLERGCEVHLLHSPRPRRRAFLPAIGWHWPRTATPRQSYPLRRGIHPADLAAARWVRRYIREHGPFDVVHGHSAKGGALARLAAWRLRTPVFYTLHGFIAMDPSVARRLRRVYHALEWTLSKLSDRIIAVSPEEHRFCVGAGLGRGRVVMIPNGIAPIVFPSRAPHCAGLRGLASDELRRRLYRAAGRAEGTRRPGRSAGGAYGRPAAR